MRELKGWHVLLVLVVFFGVTIAVNIAMATYAITTFSGEDIANPYAQGVAYNKTLAARSAQRSLGWTATLEIRRGTTGETSIDVSVKDRDAHALDGLSLEAMLRRPTDANLDRTIALASVGEGRYTASTTGLAPGQWDVIARAKGSDGIFFEAARRVVLQ